MRISNPQCWQSGYSELPYQYAKKSNSLSCQRNPADCSPLHGAAAAPRPASYPSGLASHLKRFLAPDANGRIHREQLPHGIFHFLLQREAPETAERYADLFDRFIGQGTPPRSAENTLKLVLQTLAGEGLLSKGKAEQMAEQFLCLHSAMPDII